jgi:hypothetical protein
MEEPIKDLSAPIILKLPLFFALLFFVIVYPLLLVIGIYWYRDWWFQAMATLWSKFPAPTQLALDYIPDLKAFYVIGTLSMCAVHLRVKSVSKRRLIYLLYVLAWQLIFTFVLWDLSIPFGLVKGHGIQLR